MVSVRRVYAAVATMLIATGAAARQVDMFTLEIWSFADGGLVSGALCLGGAAAGFALLSPDER